METKEISKAGKITKQECLEELDFIMYKTANSAVYFTACNYYDTVSKIAEDQFEEVADWYDDQIYILLKCC